MTARISAVYRQVEALFGAGTSTGLSDGELLDRFLRCRDLAAEAAFEALVNRHGPMVLATCRRLVREPDDAADAFQATFLVLARRAASVRDPAALGPWLYRVARHSATRARLRSTRRRDRERLVAITHADATEPASDPAEYQELRDVLDEELGRLPRTFRAPMVLCYLEGLTHDEAAAILCCPVGTIRSRLARARDRLRTRLTLRGVAPTVVATVVSGAPRPASAALQTPLVSPTVRAASLLAGGDQAAARALVGRAFPLMEGVIRTMVRTSWIKIAAVAVFTGVCLGLIASVAQRALVLGQEPGRPGRVATTSVDQSQAQPKEARGNWRFLSGLWDVVKVENSGREVATEQAGFNECYVLAPKAGAKSGADTVGWLILQFDRRLFCELQVKRVDFDAKPNVLDLFTVRDIPAGKGGKPSDGLKDYQAIFRLAGDELTLCLGKPNGDRPGKFAAEAGSGQMLVKLRRRPPPSPAPAPGRESAPARPDRKSLPSAVEPISCLGFDARAACDCGHSEPCDPGPDGRCHGIVLVCAGRAGSGSWPDPPGDHRGLSPRHGRLPDRCLGRSGRVSSYSGI